MAQHAHFVSSLRQTEKMLCRCDRKDLPPAAQWLRDNARALYTLSLSHRQRKRQRASKRMQNFCRELTHDLSAPLAQEEIYSALMHAQEDAPFSVSDLRLLTAALTDALLHALTQLLPAVTQECSDYATGERLTHDPSAALPQSPVSAFRAMELLSQSGDHEALSQLERQLRARNTPPRACMHQAREQLEHTARSVSSLIITLLSLSRLRTEDILRRASEAYRLLSRDPVFLQMDESSRNLYLTGVSTLSRKSKKSEREVIEVVFSLCKKGEGVQAQSGYYLLENPDEALRALGAKTPFSQLKTHKFTLFLVIWGIFAFVIFLPCAYYLPWYTLPPFLFPALQLGRTALHFFAARIFPPRRLPRLDESHFPAGTRALIAVPTVLLSERHALRMCRQLSMLYHANPDAPADFLLLADFTDHDAAQSPDDNNILRAAQEGISALCSAHGERFFYLHRARTFHQGEGCYIGRERKRGALLSLCRLITERACDDTFCCATIAPEALVRYTHVITLDSDTFLPARAPFLLLGAMLHPLQKGRTHVIQPRMLTLPMHVHTHAQALLGGMSGTDGYDGASGEFYQDAFARGSFMGKGILSPADFLAATRDLPPDSILSHDLLEGELCHSQLAEDILCYDGHPRTAEGFLRRLHRWTRGDWQLLPFIGDKRLDALSRIKMLDNLRISLTPALRLLSLLLSACFGRYVPFVICLLPLMHAGDFARLILLPSRALTTCSAALCALWRTYVSRRHMLEWTTAAQTEQSDLGALKNDFFPLLCGAAMMLLSAAHIFWPGFALGVIWLCSPLFMRWLSRERVRPAMFSPVQREQLLVYARDTLAFFTDHVNSATHHLPPDNVQTDPPRGAAMRTSPTNIGMYLLSLCAAREMNLIDSDDMLLRMDKCLTSLERLPTWHGVPYNWYDLRTLTPLAPRFVSSVDAGNYALCLMLAAQCARTRVSQADKSLRQVPARLDALWQQMEIYRLYNAERELFYIGYNADANTHTDGCYDLFASESVLLSYFTIATGCAPERHWWRLGRMWTLSPHKTLLSWSGTMFEYLLPAIFLPADTGTALHKMQLGCVRTQLRHARGALFGVSESGYAQFDPELNYRYKAFGMPELSLDASCNAEVIAPYAAALALPYAPEAAMRALEDMQKRGWYDRWGFFEAIDFSRSEQGDAVHSHMAHHQGMILCAICNALCNNYLPRTLSLLPLIYAHLPLLGELAPRRVLRLPSPLQAHRDARPAAPFRMQADKALPPDTLVLSGGGATLMVNARGESVLSRGDILLTRRDPAASAPCGPQFYLYDRDERFNLRVNEGEYTFLHGEAQCRTSHNHLRAQLNICIDPLTGASVYRLRIRNAGENERHLYLGTYLEPALATYREDGTHIAFSNLFFAIEATPNGLIARRRSRDGHSERSMALVAYDAPALARMNDRAHFIGREGSVDAPRGMALHESDFVLTASVDVCMALRLGVTVPAGREAEVCFALGKTVPEDAQHAARAFSLAHAGARVKSDMLSLDARMLALCCRMAGQLFFGRAALTRTPAREGIHALWRQGISGDLPILLLSAQDEQSQSVIHQAAHAAAYLLENGAQLDLVLLLPPENDYERPLRAFCDTLLLEPALRALHGHAYLLSGPDAESTQALCDFAALHIDAQQALAAQLTCFAPASPLPPAEKGGRPGVLPRLKKWNGYGGFLPDGAYVIAPPEGSTPPAPWCHILCNAHVGTLLSYEGILSTSAGNSRLRRVTQVCQDSVVITPAEEYLLCENGRAWSLTPLPYHNARTRVTFDMGTATYESALPGLSATLNCFADSDLPASLRLLTLKNTSSEKRALRFIAAARFSMGEDGRATYVSADQDTVCARCAAMPGCAFFHLEDARARVVRSDVYGNGESIRHIAPEGSGTVGILTRDLTLAPHQTLTLIVSIGFCADETTVSSVLAPLQHARERERKARLYWQQRLQKLQFFLPNQDLARYLNSFLPYQVRASRLMLRAGFYQSGGAWGFRDQLQDMLALMYTEPETVREHLLRCAARQYAQGDVQHWWHPDGAGVRTRISDDLLFLPYITARYVYVTGDTQVLTAHAPFLRSAPLAPHEHDRYETPEITSETASLMNHCLRAIRYVKYGPHGAPLMGGGDWNDGMDRVQGESAWLGFFLIVVLRDFAPLCDKNTQKELENIRHTLENAMRNAWTGKWFLRAWYPDGRTIGAPDSEVPRIDLISQCFAAFAGMPRDQVRTALHYACDALHLPDAGITLLLTPPFTPEENAGYIGAYAPGVRENGGQYTHAVPWLMRALLMMGERETAWQILAEILPYNHADTPDKAHVYRTEPYALAADIYRTGRGGWTWYTGSAAWLYDVFLRDFLGFDKQGERVRLRPRVPAGWEECTLLYHFGASRYQLTAARDASFVSLDGAHVQGTWVTLIDDGRAHEARFPLEN